jgi:signal transduction histidine kinase/FixJ family two-component response regulator
MAAGKKNSVLIVDDEKVNISTLKGILSPEYTVYASINGKEAIETANKFLPDIILLDVLMPDLDGYETITILKESEKTKYIPVIFITGLDDNQAEIKGLALGALDYISKPFNHGIVKLRVQHQMQLVQRHRQQTTINKIAHNFLVNAHTDTLQTDVLRMVGEFMSINAILLYKIDKNKNMLVCKNEWILPELGLETCIGDKMQLNDKITSAANNLLSDNDSSLYLQSANVNAKNYLELNKENFNNYIVTPILIKGKMSAFLVFSRGDSDWNENDIDLAVLVASIFSGVFERDAIQQEESLSRAKSEFLSRMSHEMRTPMNAILGMLQVIKVSGVPDNIKNHCNTMNDAAQSLMRLINDVLDISDLGYGTFKLSDAVFDFKEMVFDVLKNMDITASKKKQILDCKVDQAIPAALSGDEKRLRQVINNILANAVKFTSEEGEIFFSAKLTGDDNGIVTIQIEVSDNGIGISKEQQDRLFSMFEQIDGSLTRGYGGIGVGLALSKRIIEMMGGTIWFESEKDKGSKFYFTCKLKK